MFGDQVEVLSGVSEGDVVVMNPGSEELDGKKTSAVPQGTEKHS
jgi:hypothetical protein